MSAPRPSEAILADRLRTVLELTEANAAHRRAQAGAGGAAIERMSVEEGRADGAAASEVEARDAAARSEMGETAERMRALSDRLDALDRELAAGEE